MSTLDDLIVKIPKPILVFVVLAGTLALIVSQNPLADGCDVEMSNFTRLVSGLLTNNKNQKQKVQYAKISYFKDNCRQSNSQGGCSEYFIALKKVADDLSGAVSEKCYPRLVEEFPNLLNELASGVKIMALAAWGEKPPEGLSSRIGWLTEADIYSFCRAKDKLIKLTTPEDFKALRNSVYIEFPDQWPESLSLEKRAEVARPRAFKSAINPAGKYDEKQIYQLSLFSIRCDLYQ